MIKDSGERIEFGTGFVRDMHDGKGRFDLLPWAGIWEVAKHCEEGAKKYGERNIDKGAPQHSLIDSAFRHLAKYMMGWDDEEHLRAAAWNVLWALDQSTYAGKQDLIDIPMVRENIIKVPHEEMDSWSYRGFYIQVKFTPIGDEGYGTYRVDVYREKDSLLCHHFDFPGKGVLDEELEGRIISAFYDYVDICYDIIKAGEEY